MWGACRARRWRDPSLGTLVSPAGILWGVSVALSCATWRGHGDGDTP